MKPTQIFFFLDFSINLQNEKQIPVKTQKIKFSKAQNGGNVDHIQEFPKKCVLYTVNIEYYLNVLHLGENS